MTLRAEREFEDVIERYCDLFFKRVEEQRVGTTAFAWFLRIAIRFGFKKTVHKRIRKMTIYWLIRRLQMLLRSGGCYGLPAIHNHSEALQALSALECSLDSAHWLISMSPFISERDEVRRDVRQHDLRHRMVLIREAVLNQDWPKVGNFIGRLPAFRRNLKEVPTSFRRQLSNSLNRTCRMVLPYSSSIFRAGVQRFMNHNIPYDVVARSSVELLLALVEAERKKNFESSNNSLLYTIELLIYTICNGLNEDSEELINATLSFPAVSQTLKYNTVLRAYKALHIYEKWRLGVNDGGSQWYIINLSDDLVAAITDVESGEETVFIYALTHYLVATDECEKARDVLIKCCERTPSMIHHAYIALMKNNQPKEADQLLSMILQYSSLCHDSILLDCIEPRLFNLYSYDFSDDLLQSMCKALFTFLDYGTNRANERAWGLLWAALETVSDRSLLSTECDSRRSWWAKFHRVELSETADTCRKKILNFLDHCREDLH